MMRPTKNQAGFTMVELLLATTFFSFILLFFSFGFVQINRTFQRGQTIKRVTQAGRAAIEDVSRNIRTSGSDGFELLQKDAGDGVNRLCLGNGTDYGWNEADEIENSDVEALVDPGGGVIAGEFSLVKSELIHESCAGPFTQFDEPQTVNAGSASEYKTQGITSLLDEDMTVQNFDITEVEGINALRIDLTISVDSVGSIAAGGGGSGADATCDGFIGQGDEYCDVVRFSTIVSFRLQ